MVGEKVLRKRWGWVLGALIAIFVAVAMTSRIAPEISIFGRTNKPCHCAQVIGFFANFIFVFTFSVWLLGKWRTAYCFFKICSLGKRKILKLFKSLFLISKVCTMSECLETLHLDLLKFWLFNTFTVGIRLLIIFSNWNVEYTQV